MRTILLIGAGGFIGSIARYYVSKLNLIINLFSLPWGTLLINITGSFILGFLVGISEKSDIMPAGLRLFLMVGFCGGFTTFSTFAGENMTLLHSGQLFQALVYTGLSVFLGFTAVFTGYALTNLL
jgi:CrcB protein